MSQAVRLAGPAAAPRPAHPPPLSLYVHLPWCLRKCPYCDFNSHEAKGEVPEQEYVEALLRDLEQALPSVWGRRVGSVFLGGGTPSLFSARSIDALLSGLRARVPMSADCEITLEANPGTFEAEKFRAFRAAGVNRLSIGVQSFNSGHLEALGRVHDGAEARRAVEVAGGHFDNVNLDLMYGLPGQTPADARADAEAALAQRVAHLSFYQLTIEPHTRFHRHPPPLPDEDACDAMQSEIEIALAQAGYSHYEVSAWAVPGRECRHNLNYWRFGDYLGIGAGAHSKLSLADRILRQTRWRQPGEYLRRCAEGAPIQEQHEVSRADVVFEFMMNALRLTEGFPCALLAERTGVPIVAAQQQLARAEAKGLVERDHQRVRATALGRRFLNDLLQIFLPEGRERAAATRGQ